MKIKAKNKAEWIKVYAQQLAIGQNVLPKEKHFEAAKRAYYLTHKKSKK